MTKEYELKVQNVIPSVLQLEKLIPVVHEVESDDEYITNNSISS